MRATTRFCLIGCAIFSTQLGFAQSPPDSADRSMVDKIKQEGLDNSQVMQTISYLTDVHGPRLTGSPYAKSAAKWTLSQLADWGLENGHTEDWGPFGRGWTLEHSSVNLVEPNYAPLIAHVKAWSPSTTRSVRGVPIYLDASTEEELEKYRGKLGRAIVLISPPRQLNALFEPPAARKTQEQLLRLANSRPPAAQSSRSSARRPTPPAPAAESSELPPAAATITPAATDEKVEDSAAPAKPVPQTQGDKPTAEQPASENPKPAVEATAAESTSQPAPKPAPDPRALARLQSDKWQLAYSEGAAVVLEPGRGDGGNVFVASVVMPRNSDDPGAQGNRNSQGPRPWASESTEIIPQAVLAAEHYNRLVRMIEKGVNPVVEVDIVCQYYNDDPNSFNIIAEIPGSDLKDEIVMLGGHFDSWQSGTGATDNAVGCGVAMEAIRILKAIDAKPRRTIRLALWTGEEQGLLGSRAYVEQHFGKVVYEAPSDDDAGQNGRRSRPQATYHLKPEQEKVSAYFNLDNGTGKIRGIYLQGNEQLRTIFGAWLTPFEDMDAATVSASNTGGTDHQSFDAIGIPGFQFIQDSIEYDTRTHHSSMDVYDRIQEDDVKQASIIMASFVYHTAMRDERLPRKPLNGPVTRADVTPATLAADKELEPTTEPATQVGAATP